MVVRARSLWPFWPKILPVCLHGGFLSRSTPALNFSLSGGVLEGDHTVSDSQEEAVVTRRDSQEEAMSPFVGLLVLLGRVVVKIFARETQMISL